MPSLSVVYKNNPNFRVVHLDPDLRAIVDYEQWYMNLVMATGMVILLYGTTYKNRAFIKIYGPGAKITLGRFHMFLKYVNNNFSMQPFNIILLHL
jgi:hypothetical protein